MGTPVRANEEEVEAGERAQDGEARNPGSADAGSEEEKSSDEHGASHVGHVEQDSWEDEQTDDSWIGREELHDVGNA